MTDSNLNFWGEIAVPVGLLICFGPALFIWFMAELKAPKEKQTVETKPRENPRH
jgi:hypothetical protein